MKLCRAGAQTNAVITAVLLRLRLVNRPRSLIGEARRMWVAEPTSGPKRVWQLHFTSFPSGVHVLILDFVILSPEYLNSLDNSKAILQPLSRSAPHRPSYPSLSLLSMHEPPVYVRCKTSRTASRLRDAFLRVHKVHQRFAAELPKDALLRVTVSHRPSSKSATFPAPWVIFQSQSTP